MLYTKKFVFTVSLCAMLAANPVLAVTDPVPAVAGAKSNTPGVVSTVYSDWAGRADSGIAGVTYVNNAVDAAGNAAQWAENHAAAAAQSAKSAADSAAQAASKVSIDQGETNVYKAMVTDEKGTVYPGYIAPGMIKNSTDRNAPVLVTLSGSNGLLYADWGQVDSWAIADGEVKSSDIANGAVTSAKIAARAVSEDKLYSSGQVEGVVLMADGNAGAEWGQVGSAGIADGAVTSAKIADGAVTERDISTGGRGSILITNSDYKVEWMTSGTTGAILSVDNSGEPRWMTGVTGAFLTFDDGQLYWNSGESGAVWGRRANGGLGWISGKNGSVLVNSEGQLSWKSGEDDSVMVASGGEAVWSKIKPQNTEGVVGMVPEGSPNATTYSQMWIE